VSIPISHGCFHIGRLSSLSVGFYVKTGNDKTGNVKTGTSEYYVAQNSCTVTGKKIENSQNTLRNPIVGTCESYFFVRIESAVRFVFESNIESNRPYTTQAVTQPNGLLQAYNNKLCCTCDERE